MATIADIKGTTNNSFRIGNGATIIQGEDEPNNLIGKLGDVYIRTLTGVVYTKNKKDGHENGIWESFKTYYFDDPIIDDEVSVSGTDHTITIQQASAPTGAGISDQTVTTDVITGDYHDNYGVMRFATENEAALGKLRNVAISPATLATVSQNAIVYRGIWGVEQAVTTYAFFETQRQAQPTGILKAGSLYFVGGLPTSTNPSYYSGSFNTPTVGSEYVLTIVEPSGNKTYNTGVLKTTDQSVDNDNLAHWCSDHYLQFVSTADVRERPWCKIGDTVYEYGDHVIFAEDWDGSTPITTDILNKFDNTEATDIVRLNAHQTLTNKNIDADTNVIQNIRVTRTGAQQAGLSTYTTNFADGVVRQAVRDFATSSHDSLATEKAIRIELDTKPSATDGELAAGNFLKLKEVRTDANNHSVIVGEWVDYVPDIPLFKFDLFDHVPENTGWIASNFDNPLPIDGTEYVSAYDLLERNYVGQNYTYEKTFSVVLYKWMTTSDEAIYTSSSDPEISDDVYTYNDTTKVFSLSEYKVSTHYSESGSDYIKINDGLEKIYNNQNTAVSGEYSISIVYKCNLANDTKSGYRICDASTQQEKLNRLYNLTGSAWFYQIDTVNKTFNLPRGKNYLRGENTTPIDNPGTMPGYGDFTDERFGDVWVAGEEVHGGMSYNHFGLYFYLGNTVLYDTTIDLRDILTTLQTKENMIVPGDASITVERVGNQTKIYAHVTGTGSYNYSDLTNKPKINGVTIDGNKTGLDYGLLTKADADTFYLGINDTPTNCYTKTEVNTLLSGKADASTTYTKTEVNTLLSGKANADNVYTKLEVDGFLNAKADASTTYTKTEVNTLLNDKADASSVYTKSEVDNALSNKANVSDLAGKEDVANKTTTLTSASTDTEYPSAKAVYDNLQNYRLKINEVSNLNDNIITLTKALENTVYKYGEVETLNILDFDSSNYETVIYFHSLENFTSCEVTTNPAGTIYYAKSKHITGGVVDAGESIYTDIGCTTVYEASVTANTYFTNGNESQQQSGGVLNVPSNVPHIGLLPVELNNSYYRLTIKNGIFELNEYTVGQTVTIIANNGSEILTNIT